MKLFNGIIISWRNIHLLFLLSQDDMRCRRYFCISTIPQVWDPPPSHLVWNRTTINFSDNNMNNNHCYYYDDSYQSPVFHHDIFAVFEVFVGAEQIERICHSEEMLCPTQICWLVPSWCIDVHSFIVQQFLWVRHHFCFFRWSRIYFDLMIFQGIYRLEERERVV